MILQYTLALRTPPNPRSAVPDPWPSESIAATTFLHLPCAVTAYTSPSQLPSTAPRGSRVLGLLVSNFGGTPSPPIPTRRRPAVPPVHPIVHAFGTECGLLHLVDDHGTTLGEIHVGDAPVTALTQRRLPHGPGAPAKATPPRDTQSVTRLPPPRQLIVGLATGDILDVVMELDILRDGDEPGRWVAKLQLRGSLVAEPTSVIPVASLDFLRTGQRSNAFASLMATYVDGSVAVWRAKSLMAGVSAKRRRSKTTGSASSSSPSSRAEDRLSSSSYPYSSDSLLVDARFGSNGIMSIHRDGSITSTDLRSLRSFTMSCLQRQLGEDVSVLATDVDPRANEAKRAWAFLSNGSLVQLRLVASKERLRSCKVTRVLADAVGFHKPGVVVDDGSVSGSLQGATVTSLYGHVIVAAGDQVAVYDTRVQGSGWGGPFRIFEGRVRAHLIPSLTTNVAEGSSLGGRSWWSGWWGDSSAKQIAALDAVCTGWKDDASQRLVLVFGRRQPQKQITKKHPGSQHQQRLSSCRPGSATVPVIFNYTALSATARKDADAAARAKSSFGLRAMPVIIAVVVGAVIYLNKQNKRGLSGNGPFDSLFSAISGASPPSTDMELERMLAMTEGLGSGSTAAHGDSDRLMRSGYGRSMGPRGLPVGPTPGAQDILDRMQRLAALERRGQRGTVTGTGATTSGASRGYGSSLGRRKAVPVRRGPAVLPEDFTDNPSPSASYPAGLDVAEWEARLADIRATHVHEPRRVPVPVEEVEEEEEEDSLVVGGLRGD